MINCRFLVASMLLIGFCTFLPAKDIPAELEGTELYDWLGYEGIYDPELENDTVIEILEKGLSSEDSEVAGAAINAIVFYTSWIDVDSWIPGEPRPIDRELQRIPGLKKLLVETWEREFARNPSFQDNRDLDEGMEFRNGRGSSFFERRLANDPQYPCSALSQGLRCSQYRMGS